MRQLLLLPALGLTLPLVACKSTGQPHVNRAPVAVEDSAEVSAGGSVIIDVLANDTDADGDDLAIDPSSVTMSGGWVDDIDAEAGLITFRAPPSVGTYKLNYVVTDGLATGYGTVLVSVQ
ncbi:MAG: Ig-like domain-containing protein [Planctomycetota bacterium]|nr:Ig-like domain-containing protein [Planctomycetota bacterium]